MERHRGSKGKGLSPKGRFRRETAAGPEVNNFRTVVAKRRMPVQLRAISTMV
ncbi:MAG: hypothetical protein IJ056_08870 [Acidaminococcaceae bacterium]|nr:hypothetical protein [Acidaminococcaceae bacterium]